jgi:hypothetical protein
VKRPAARPQADPFDYEHVRSEPVLRYANIRIGGNLHERVKVYRVNNLGGLLVDINGRIRWCPGSWESV